MGRSKELTLQGMYDEGFYDAKAEYDHLTNYQKVREFHKAFMPGHLDQDFFGGLVDLRMSLISEEVHEVQNELFDPLTYVAKGIEAINKAALAKELADLLYVVYGTAATFGIDIDRVFDEVHKSNMSKLGDDGKPVYREDGKVLKGPNYKPPKLDWITK